ncbi:unnamed protein product [Arctogadus glacialis]
MRRPHSHVGPSGPPAPAGDASDSTSPGTVLHPIPTTGCGCSADGQASSSGSGADQGGASWRLRGGETPCGEATLAPEPKKKRRKTTTTSDAEQPATVPQPTPARAETRLPEGWRTALTGEQQDPG